MRIATATTIGTLYVLTAGSGLAQTTYSPFQAPYTLYPGGVVQPIDSPQPVAPLNGNPSNGNLPDRAPVYPNSSGVSFNQNQPDRLPPPQPFPPIDSQPGNRSPQLQRLSQEARAQGVYRQAREELSEQFYVLYRIVDRLVRANRLDHASWQVSIGSDATGSDGGANVIAIDRHLLNQLNGDVDALAYVIAGEMARQIHHQSALSESEKTQVLANLRAEAEKEAQQEVNQSARRGAGEAQIGRAIVRTIGGFLGGVGGIVANLVDNAFQGKPEDNTALLEQRTEELYQAKMTAQEQQWVEHDLKQNMEVDQYSYQYMATAGFDPIGCFRAMNLIAWIQGNQSEASNTLVQRVDAIKAAMTELPAAHLKTMGRDRLQMNHQPLSYAVIQGGQTLRLSSQKIYQEFDDRFPQ